MNSNHGPSRASLARGIDCRAKNVGRGARRDHDRDGALAFAHADRGPMEPVLDQAFSDADVVQIAAHLTEKKVSHYEKDGKIYVPADRKLEVLSDLIYSDTLIGNTESGFDALVKESSLFDSPSKADKMFNHAREEMLQSIVREFPRRAQGDGPDRSDQRTPHQRRLDHADRGWSTSKPAAMKPIPTNWPAPPSMQ